MADYEMNTEQATRERQAQEQRNAPKRTIKVKNTSPKGSRFLFDATGKQHLLGPGQELEVEVTEPVAKQLEEQSKGGSNLYIEGHDPETVQRLEDAPEEPEEHKSRVALAEAEEKLMEEGQEADKERREKVAKMRNEDLAAETGIHMHARGVKPEVVAKPPDALPKKGESQSGSPLTSTRRNTQ